MMSFSYCYSRQDIKCIKYHWDGTNPNLFAAPLHMLYTQLDTKFMCQMKKKTCYKHTTTPPCPFAIHFLCPAFTYHMTATPTFPPVPNSPIRFLL